MKAYYLTLVLTCSLLFGFITSDNTDLSSRIISHTIDLKTSDIHFYYLDNKNKPLSNFSRLKSFVESQGKTLRFAMNGGMYLKDQSPQGLYIENGKKINTINLKSSDYGNFYMKPNGVFGIDENQVPVIFNSLEYKSHTTLKYATQSGPMLLNNGQMHPRFNKGSKNVHIRNGVGILPNGNLIFAMSKERINFYDFAMFFKEKGCLNALYLDGFVSKLYLPEQRYYETTGQFGVMIGEVIE